jgi:ribosome recycling factor
MAYGSLGPLKNIAAVSVMDASTIVIQPWDKTLIKDIEK